MKYHIKCGPASISLESSDGSSADASAILSALRAWMPVESANDAVALRFAVQSTLNARSDSNSAAPSASWWDGKAWQATVQRTKQQLEWEVAPRYNAVVSTMRLVPPPLLRFAHVHHFGIAQVRASALLYGHVLPGAQLALLEHDATLAHASSLVGPRGGAVLVLGWGGAGKTSASTSLYMRQPDRWRSMSDDLAIVSSDGTLYRSPVPVNVFPYNTELFPELAAVVSRDASMSDRAQWWLRARILGSAGVARRFAPLEGFQGPASAPLAAVVELRRADVSDAVIEATTVDAIATEARRVLDHELSRGLRPMRAAYAQATASTVLPFPSPDAQLARAESTLRAALSRCQLHRITLPRRTPPDAVGRLVEQVVEGVA